MALFVFSHIKIRFHLSEIRTIFIGSRASTSHRHCFYAVFPSIYNIPPSSLVEFAFHSRQWTIKTVLHVTQSLEEEKMVWITAAKKFWVDDTQTVCEKTNQLRFSAKINFRSVCGRSNHLKRSICGLFDFHFVFLRRIRTDQLHLHWKSSSKSRNTQGRSQQVCRASPKSHNWLGPANVFHVTAEDISDFLTSASQELTSDLVPTRNFLRSTAPTAPRWAKTSDHAAPSTFCASSTSFSS